MLNNLNDHDDSQMCLLAWLFVCLFVCSFVCLFVRTLIDGEKSPNLLTLLVFVGVSHPPCFSTALKLTSQPLPIKKHQNLMGFYPSSHNHGSGKWDVSNTSFLSFRFI